MESNIYRKLSNLREALRKETHTDFAALAESVSKKAKYYKLLPLYCYYNDMATLTVVDMDEITSKAVFQIPVGLVGVNNAKEYLYSMAFDIERSGTDIISPAQFQSLYERMKERKVTEKEVLERYKLTSLTNMTQDIYKRCMTALDMSKGQQS